MPKPIPEVPTQVKSSNRKKFDFNQFYDKIITDSMSDFSFRDSQNPEIHRLHQKASLLAASSLAKSTKSNYGRAWVRFLDFCKLMGLSPMETSGQDIADWLVYRSERTKSPNVSESDLKAISCFRKAAGKTVSKVHIAEAMLIGLLKTKEANSLLQLGLEPEMVQKLIHKAFYEFGPEILWELGKQPYMQ